MRTTHERRTSVPFRVDAFMSSGMSVTHGMNEWRVTHSRTGGERETHTHTQTQTHTHRITGTFTFAEANGGKERRDVKALGHRERSSVKWRTSKCTWDKCKTELNKRERCTRTPWESRSEVKATSMQLFVYICPNVLSLCRPLLPLRLSLFYYAGNILCVAFFVSTLVTHCALCWTHKAFVCMCVFVCWVTTEFKRLYISNSIASCEVEKSCALYTILLWKRKPFK